MSRPARRAQKDQISLYIKRQAWILFILIVMISLLDVIWLHSQLVIAKSFAIGASLSFVNQAVFASFVFRHSGYRARRHIVSQMYRGQTIKWLLTVVGFALIFITIKPLLAPALFIGFIIMQLSHSGLLWYIR